MSEAWSLLVAGACGLVVGSFVTTAVLRAAQGRLALTGRSSCDSCGVRLSYAATAPLVSYAWTGGRCAGCRARIDPLHPLGEIAGLVVMVTAVATGHTVGRSCLIAILGLALIASAVWDARRRRLPDLLTGLIAACCLALAALDGRLAQGVAAAAVAFLILELMRRWLSARLGRPALGFGDVKLIAALTLWLGAGASWMLAAASALTLVAVRLLKPADGALPFGPAIAASAWVIGAAQQWGLR